MRTEDNLRARRLVFYEKDVARIEKVLEELLKLSGAKLALLVDREGHLVTRIGAPVVFDIESVSALVAGSFAATKEMARCMGEDEFSIMFHQGKKDSIQLTLVGERALLGIIFNDKTTIGMVRLYAQEAARRLSEIFVRSDKEHPDEEKMNENFAADAKGKLNDVFGE